MQTQLSEFNKVTSSYEDVPYDATTIAEVGAKLRDTLAEAIGKADRVGEIPTGDRKDQDGEVNATALNTALIDLISRNLADHQKKRTSRATYQPEGKHCSLQLTLKKNALLFQLLRAGKSGTFQLLAPSPSTTIERNPFAGMADVRVTHGPFCQWTLCISKEINGEDLDLRELESINVEFAGSYRPFVRTG